MIFPLTDYFSFLTFLCNFPRFHGKTCSGGLVSRRLLVSHNQLERYNRRTKTCNFLVPSPPSPRTERAASGTRAAGWENIAEIISLLENFITRRFRAKKIIPASSIQTHRSPSTRVTLGHVRWVEGFFLSLSLSSTRVSLSLRQRSTEMLSIGMRENEGGGAKKLTPCLMYTERFFIHHPHPFALGVGPPSFWWVHRHRQGWCNLIIGIS